MSRLLLDTHVWLWSIAAPNRLGQEGRDLLENADSELYLSSASSWEISIKYRLGRLRLPEPPHLFIPPRLVRDSINPLPVTHQHACEVANLPDHHRDPFDRLLVAQAQIEQLIFVTADSLISGYDVEIIRIRS